MKITETTNNGNNVSRISKLLDTGNIAPTIWYHKLLRESGKPDCTAIAILSELVLLYRDQSSKEFQLNFKYFRDKFNFGLSQVKDAVIRLEKLGLVTRSPRTVIILGRTFVNEMFLLLNIDKVLEISEENDPKKFQYSIRDNNNHTIEISSDNQDELKNDQYIVRNLGIPSLEISPDSQDNTKKVHFVVENSYLSSVEISSDHNIDLYKNSNISRSIDISRYRSSESSFLKNFNEKNGKEDIEKNKEADTFVTNSLQLGEIREAANLNRTIAEPVEQSNFKTFDKNATGCCQKEVTDKEVEVKAEGELKPDTEIKTEENGSSHDQSIPASMSEKQPNVITRIRSKFSFFGKKLSEFHPLSNEDRDLLVAKSGRDFDLNFINQLLLKMGDKYPLHKFYNKNCVLNYMTKLLAYELRDVVKVSNGCFKFKNNEKDEQITGQERYLQEIESSVETCKAMRLKRKIAGIFESSTAYFLLWNTEFSLNGDEFTININNKTPIVLSVYQQDILLAQVRSVYGDNVLSLNIQVPEQIQVPQPLQAATRMQLRAEIQPQTTLHTELELCNESVNQRVSVNRNEINSYNSSHATNYSNNYGNNNTPTPAAGIISKETASQDHDSIWGRVRSSLIEHFRDGEWLDRNWFSKLEAIYDHDSQKLTLKAPTKLIRDRVWQQYGYLIARYCTDMNYQLVGVQS